MKKILNTLAQTAFFAGVMFAVPALAQAATLTLSPSSGTHAVDSTFEVKIQLDTGGVATDGTDAYLKFDPTILQVVDANASTTGTQILAGSLYTQTTLNTVDNGAGTIRFSGARSGASSGYTGSGTLATITFKAISGSSSTPVTFDFTAGSTNLSDTNVIQNSDSTDVLTSVTNGAYKITGGSSSGSTDGSSDTTDSDGDGIPDSQDTDNTSGQGGGSGDVASSGIDLNGYMAATVASLAGAMYFLSRSRRTRSSRR